MTHVHHTFDYIEINASDLPATRSFYETAFGWEFNDYGPEYAGIRSADGQGEVGGLNATAAPSSGGPLVMLYSDNLDDSVSAVERAGGNVTNGPYEFPGGRRFHFTDPSGNELGVWANA